MTNRDILAALIVMAIWGASFSVIKIGLAELPPVLFVAARFLLVAIPAVFFVPFPKTSVWNVILVGVFIGIIKFGLLFIAMRADANAGLASLVLQSQVVFTIALSWIVFQERPSSTQLAGIGIAVAGFAFFYAAAGANITQSGFVLITGAGMAWAVANLIMKRIPEVNLLHFMIWASLVPPVPLLIISFYIEPRSLMDILPALSLQSWLVLAYMGYLSTLVAYGVWGRLLSSYPAASVAPFALLIPVFGMIIAAIWLRENMTGLEIVGIITVMLGLSICILESRIRRATSLS